MIIEQLADMYVDFIEPALKLGAFSVLVIVVLHFLNILKTGGSAHSFVGRSYAVIAKWVAALVKFLHKLIRRILKILAVYTHAVYVTVKEFLSVRN